MLLAKKIRLKPTPEQEILFRKSCGVARWAYNFYISENNRVYQEYLKNGKKGKQTISDYDVRKYINNVLKPSTHTWLKDVGSNVMKQGVRDAYTAYSNFYKGISSHPRYKTKHSGKMSFYVNYETLSARNGGFRGEKIGFVRTSEPLPTLQPREKYVDPRISFDGKYWYLSIGYRAKPECVELTDVSLGIDLGVKELAICSNGKYYSNINKSDIVKRLERKIKREQRALSRKIRCNTIGYNEKRQPIYRDSLENCRNIQKQKRVLKLLYRRLSNIRNDYIHKTTTEIVKTKPSRIVMENLNIIGMIKNRYLAKAILDQKFFMFKRFIKYKSEKYGIDVVEAPRFFPSSKMCSNCGCVKRTLLLSERFYHCDECGFVIDRDLNASINLSNYYPAS